MSAEGRVLSIHFGRSANCSSVGSVVDVLFVSSTVGMAILASAAILLRKHADSEETGVHEGRSGDERDDEKRARDEEEE